jgi:hypothetical protein
MLPLNGTAAHGRALLCQLDALHCAVVALSAWALKHVAGKVPQSNIGECMSAAASITSATDLKCCASLMFCMSAAALSDQARLINTMASRGANINAPDIHGKTPLHYAIAAGSAKERLGDFDGMARTCVTVKVLLRQGANLMVKDGHGKYPLALASTQMSGVVEDEVYLLETRSDDLQDGFC